MAERNLRLIGSLFCRQYQTQAHAFIDEAHPSGHRHLVVRYLEGGYKDEPEFVTAIPDTWTDQDLIGLLTVTLPVRGIAMTVCCYPAWEVPARAYGSVELFRWWKGEKAS
jgi:hypothetical protein